jgi:hypothetical protein
MSEIKIKLTDEQEDAITIASLKESYKNVKSAKDKDTKTLLQALSTVLKFYGADHGD